MAKLFRIKNKKLRFLVGAVVLLVLIGVVGTLALITFWWLGQGAYALKIDLIVKFIEDYQGEVQKLGVFIAGFSVALAIAVVIIYGRLFLKKAKELGDFLFNSVGKKQRQSG